MKKENISLDDIKLSESILIKKALKRVVKEYGLKSSEQLFNDLNYMIERRLGLAIQKAKAEGRAIIKSLG